MACSSEDESELSDLEDFEVLVQDTHCNKFLNDVVQIRTDLEEHLKPLIPLCVDCSTSKNCQFCRFQGLRRVTIDGADIKVDLMGGRFTQYEDVDGQKPDFYYDLLFNPRLKMENIAYLRECIAPILLPFVLEEMKILQENGEITLVRRFKSPDYVDKCDQCLWTFTFLSWICIRCGEEYCIKCRQKKAPCHCGSSTLLSSTINPVSLRALALKLEETQPSPSADLNHSEPASTSRHIPILTGEWSTPEFLATWTQGRPLIVRNHAGLQLDWSPQSLARFLGDDSCEIVDCEDPLYTRRTTVQQFLEEEMNGKGTKSRVLKLKDYPTEATFKEKCSRLARDFSLALPVPEFTSDEGCLNIANYFPSNYRCSPDIGPKIYAAMGTRQDNDRHGSTRLHMDMADAVNIMASDGKARWDIFIPEDSQKIREYIRSKRSEDDGDDPIHAQDNYLRESDLKELRLVNVIPFTFEQSRGDCVFIPAGCAHQVSNITACIKIAADFVSPQSLSRCAQVAEELRICNTASDCLEFSNLIIHAWMALQSLEGRCLNQGSIPRSINPFSRGCDTGQDDHDVRLEQEPRPLDVNVPLTMAPISMGDVTQQFVADGVGGTGHVDDVDLWQMDPTQGWVGMSPQPPSATTPTPVLPAAVVETQRANVYGQLYRMPSEPAVTSIADLAQPRAQLYTMTNAHMRDTAAVANDTSLQATADQDDIRNASNLIFRIGLTRVVDAISRQGDQLQYGHQPRLHGGTPRPSQHSIASNTTQLVAIGQLQQSPWVTATDQLQQAMMGHSTTAIGTSRSTTGSLAFEPSSSMQLPGTPPVYGHSAVAAPLARATTFGPLTSVFPASSRQDYFQNKAERTCSTCHLGESACRGAIRRRYCPQWNGATPPPRKKRRSDN